MPARSNIETYLENILSARYGEDVRQSIHDAIAQVYTDAAQNPIVSGGISVIDPSISIPFTDANTMPPNSIWNINTNITEDHIKNLPVYGAFGTILTYQGDVNTTRYGCVQLYITEFGDVWQRFQIPQSTWTDWILLSSIEESRLLDYLFMNSYNPASSEMGKTFNPKNPSIIIDHYGYFISDYIPIKDAVTISGFPPDLLHSKSGISFFVAFYNAKKTYTNRHIYNEQEIISKGGFLIVNDSETRNMRDGYIRFSTLACLVNTIKVRKFVKSPLLDIEKEIVISRLKASDVNYANNLKFNNVSLAEKSGDTWTIQSGGHAFGLMPISLLPEIFYISVKSDALYCNYAIHLADGTRIIKPMRKSGDYWYAKVNVKEIMEEYGEGYSPYLFETRFDMQNTEEGSSATFSDLLINEGVLMDQQAAFKNVGYVSTNGNDNNDGETEDTAVATVNKALELGFETIYISGGTYNQRIDVSKAQNKAIKLRNLSTSEKVIFSPSDCVLVTTEEKVSGWTKLYRKEVEASFNVNNKWLFQNNISDATTEISDEERHPLQRGKAYRCDDTKIEKTTATDLTSALLEIESSDSYKWYYDTTTGTLYFSRPAIVTESNPIMMSKGEGLFYNADRDIELECIAINTKYYSFDVSNFARADVLDCKASNAYGGGCFRYDRNKEVKFLRCEAEHAFYGGAGDGFNGHSDSTGDPYAKQTDCSLIDCWSHDNNDDGYSDHERSEITIIGGLYEYNRKGGIVPSYGSHCTCYNVYSRKNYSGFNYIGEATTEEGGEDGQMACYGCVAENNILGSPYAGFRVSDGSNSMILVGCKSIGNTYGYIANLETNRATLIDCGSLNDGTIKSGSGVFNIKNTTLVS